MDYHKKAGILGGKAVYKKYGRKHFEKLWKLAIDARRKNIKHGITENVIERFERSYKIISNGCWQWNKSLCDGYGEFRVAHPVKRWKAHRFAYLLYKGELPEFLDHLCRNRGCVNPDHLEGVTKRENILRGVGITAKQARQTHCKRGHEFNEINTYKKKDGRECRTCHNMRSKNYRLMKKNGL